MHDESPCSLFELRCITGTDHRIHGDPRTVAVLLGWLGHQAATQSAWVGRRVGRGLI